jgi:GrpB-like predicted nucleotidyltransferase (UPF0157 family)
MVRLMHYDPRWRQEFEQTRSSLLQCCEGWVVDVQHVGSTAISGLIARPIIDAVALIDADDGWEIATELITGLNYREQPVVDFAPTARLLAKPRHGEATHHVFLFRSDDPHAQRMIAIRDWWQANPEAAMDFEQAKVDQWRCSEGDPLAYAQWKDSLFQQLPPEEAGSSPG